MSRLLIAILAGLIGFVIGSSVNPINTWINQPTPIYFPTSVPILLPARAVETGQPQVPPTLGPAPTSTPGPPSTPTPVLSRSFIIKLKGGGEMTVQASDYDSAINNVKSQGGVPAE